MALESPAVATAVIPLRFQAATLIAKTLGGSRISGPMANFNVSGGTPEVMVNMGLRAFLRQAHTQEAWHEAGRMLQLAKQMHINWDESLLRPTHRTTMGLDESAAADVRKMLKSSILEVLGSENEWGTPALTHKLKAATPGQLHTTESLMRTRDTLLDTILAATKPLTTRHLPEAVEVEVLDDVTLKDIAAAIKKLVGKSEEILNLKHTHPGTFSYGYRFGQDARPVTDRTVDLVNRLRTQGERDGFYAGFAAAKTPSLEEALNLQEMPIPDRGWRKDIIDPNSELGQRNGVASAPGKTDLGKYFQSGQVPKLGDAKKKSTCAGCGEEWPCSDCNRTDISGTERAKHYVQMEAHQVGEQTWFTVNIAIGNAAFDDDPRPELSRILFKLAKDISSLSAGKGKIRDENGNTVGEYELDEANDPLGLGTTTMRTPAITPQMDALNNHDRGDDGVARKGSAEKKSCSCGYGDARPLSGMCPDCEREFGRGPVSRMTGKLKEAGADDYVNANMVTKGAVPYHSVDVGKKFKFRPDTNAHTKTSRTGYKTSTGQSFKTGSKAAVIPTEEGVSVTEEKVTVGKLYVFSASGWDKFLPSKSPRNHGTSVAEDVPDGTVVRVITLPGAPPANTMGQCYIADPKTGEFLGMVSTKSLTPYTGKPISGPQTSKPETPQDPNMTKMITAVNAAIKGLKAEGTTKVNLQTLKNYITSRGLAKGINISGPNVQWAFTELVKDAVKASPAAKGFVTDLTEWARFAK